MGCRSGSLRNRVVLWNGDLNLSTKPSCSLEWCLESLWNRVVLWENALDIYEYELFDRMMLLNIKKPSCSLGYRPASLRNGVIRWDITLDLYETDSSFECFSGSLRNRVVFEMMLGSIRIF